MTATVKSLPFVEDHEEAEAKKLIDDEFIKLTGKPFNLRPAGYMIVVKIHVRPEELKEIKTADGTVKKLYLPDVSRTEDKFSSVAAMVCAVGPQAYKGTHADGSPRYPEGPWARCADWVVIPRNESFACDYHGVAMAILPDDKVIAVIEDPSDVTAVYVAPRI